MENDERKCAIYAQMAAVLSEIKAVAKNEKNQVQNFKYRSIDAVMNALNPALERAGVFILPEVIECMRDQKAASKNVLNLTVLKVRYHFVSGKDGSEVSAVVYGESMDAGDKSTAKALSNAFKYACFQAFCIPTEDMEEADRDTYTCALPQEQRYTELPKYAKDQVMQNVPQQYPQADAAAGGSAPKAYPSYSASAVKPVSTLEEAQALVINIGRNRGKTMFDVANGYKAASELQWYINNVPNSQEARAASLILQSLVM